MGSRQSQSWQGRLVANAAKLAATRPEIWRAKQAERNGKMENVGFYYLISENPTSPF